MRNRRTIKSKPKPTAANDATYAKEKSWYEKGYESAFWTVVLQCLNKDEALPSWVQHQLKNHALQRVKAEPYPTKGTGRSAKYLRDDFIWQSVEFLRGYWYDFHKKGKLRPLSLDQACALMSKFLHERGETLDPSSVRHAYAKGLNHRYKKDVYISPYLYPDYDAVRLVELADALYVYPSPQNPAKK